MERVRTAVLIPLVVFPSAAVVAILIGVMLHIVKSNAEAIMPPGLADFATPVVALILVVLITAAGFIASAAAGNPERS
ncbi:MAG TPA: hypothetical protein VFC51_07185 [Chloroflexota bacterium]|nr:hypothetical protein [Chloroflexota bacterium]